MLYLSKGHLKGQVKLSTGTLAWQQSCHFSWYFATGGIITVWAVNAHQCQLSPFHISWKHDTFLRIRNWNCWFTAWKLWFWKNNSMSRLVIVCALIIFQYKIDLDRKTVILCAHSIVPWKNIKTAAWPSFCKLGRKRGQCLLG